MHNSNTINLGVGNDGIMVVDNMADNTGIPQGGQAFIRGGHFRLFAWKTNERNNL